MLRNGSGFIPQDLEDKHVATCGQPNTHSFEEKTAPQRLGPWSIRSLFKDLEDLDRVSF